MKQCSFCLLCEIRDERLHFEIKIPEELRTEGKMWVWGCGENAETS